MGEEWAVMNDYAYVDDPEKVDDSRWVHRPKMEWSHATELKKKRSVRRRQFTHLQKIFEMRARTDALRGNHMRLLPADNSHVLVYLRWHDANHLIVMANFSEERQTVPVSAFRSQGFAHFCKDIFTGMTYSTRDSLTLEPYQILWLVED
jgi:amylosucrase